MALAERDQSKLDRPALAIGTKDEHEAEGRLRYSDCERHVDLCAGHEPGTVRSVLVTSTQRHLRAWSFDLCAGRSGRGPRRSSLPKAVNLLGPDILVEREPLAIDQDVVQGSALPVTGKAPELRLDLLFGRGPHAVPTVEL
jgi:hypothetical protein